MLSFSKSEPSKPHTNFALRLRRGRLGLRALRVRFLDSLLKKTHLNQNPSKTKLPIVFLYSFKYFLKRRLSKKGKNKSTNQKNYIYLSPIEGSYRKKYKTWHEIPLAYFSHITISRINQKNKLFKNSVLNTTQIKQIGVKAIQNT